MASDSTPPTQHTPGFIDLSGNERPERATMIVQAWLQKKRSEKKLYLDGPDGTLADFERKLREEGLEEGYRVVQCHLHALQPPPARYNTVMALQPTNRSQSKASGGGSRGSRSGDSGEHKAPRELTTLFWNCPVSFDFLAKVTAPEFTPAQGIKEIIDNAVQSLVFLFQIDQPRLMQHEKPQIVILIDLQRGALRIVDNGGGCVSRVPSHAPLPSTRTLLSHACTVYGALAGSTRSR